MLNKNIRKKNNENVKLTFRVIKMIAKELAFVFFFVCLFVVVSNFTIKDKLHYAISLINNVIIEEKINNNVEISFDTLEKKLISYPSFGSVWATIKIPKIGVSSPVYQGDTLSLLKYGVGHFTGSYFPGENATIIIAGHNSKDQFYHLPIMKENDEIIIETIYGKFTYEVLGTKIISAKDEKSLPIQTEKELLILYTCYPVNTIGYKSKRFVIYAEKVGESYAP